MAKPNDDTVFSLRLPARDAERLVTEARRRGITISAMARQAISDGLNARSGGYLTFGIPNSGGTLSITTVGIGTSPLARTAGCLTLDVM